MFCVESTANTKNCANGGTNQPSLVFPMVWQDKKNRRLKMKKVMFFAMLASVAGLLFKGLSVECEAKSSFI